MTSLKQKIQEWKKSFNEYAKVKGWKERTEDEKYEIELTKIKQKFDKLSPRQQDIFTILTTNTDNKELEYAKYTFLSNMFDASMRDDMKSQGVTNHTHINVHTLTTKMDETAKIVRNLELDSSLDLKEVTGGHHRNLWHLDRCTSMSITYDRYLEEYPETKPVFEEAKTLVEKVPNRQFAQFHTEHPAKHAIIWAVLNKETHKRYNNPKYKPKAHATSIKPPAAKVDDVEKLDMP